MLLKINCIHLICVVLICVQSSGGVVDGRYLPTRGNTDNLDKLRELLRDILDTDVQKASVEAPPQAVAPIRYDGLSGLNDDFNFGIPKHMQHRNSRLLLKRSAFNNLLKTNRKF